LIITETIIFVLLSIKEYENLLRLAPIYPRA